MTVSMMYLESEVPEGQTLRDWRRLQAPSRRGWIARIGATLHRV